MSMRSLRDIIMIVALALAGVGAGYIGIGFVSHGGARAASFDCAKAATSSERAICADPTLSALDAQLGAAYAQKVASAPGLRRIERGWIALRNAGCRNGVDCLEQLMRAHLAWLKSGALQPTAALPTSPGACSLTRITHVGNRLEGAPGSGSAVSEANQAYQVDYDQIPAIDRSRVGDPALVCLIGLPQHCPAGDDRGKFYAVANLRTLGAWGDADSEHMCGGA